MGTRLAWLLGEVIGEAGTRVKSWPFWGATVELIRTTVPLRVALYCTCELLKASGLTLQFSRLYSLCQLSFNSFAYIGKLKSPSLSFSSQVASQTELVS